jgi:hypothetical protein
VLEGAPMRRCIKRCGSPALTGHDLCLDCCHGELAKRSQAAIRQAKGRKAKRRPSTKRYFVSVSAEAFEQVKAKAEACGWTMTRLVEEATREV